MQFLLWGALNTVVYILVLLAVLYKYFCLIFFTLPTLKSLFSICRYALFTNAAG